MNKEIFIIRHGRTEYNKLGIWQGSGVDSVLDSVGLHQAQLFYKNYQNFGFDLIIHSTLQRSKQTIQKFIEQGIDSLEVPELNEISWGVYEGKPHTESSLAEYKKVTGEWAIENYHVGFTGGESAQELAERIRKFCVFLKNLNYDKVLICSHGRTIRALLCIMQNEPLKEMEKYEHANTGLFIARQIGSKFMIDELNNTDHLTSSV
ncbi:histidine phosphatase family protein [Portibacter marinus]|uniref:histidine phosphatase family protein n=1 Tax=Portibacter marinus TaxID=2898660 RepID=UPI001F33EF82|nr:histidine phosphatase family protein [Portibacter marinus]